MCKRSVTKGLIFATLGLCLLVLPACSKGKGHREAVNAANDRYFGLRSGLMLDMARQQFDTGDLDLAEQTIKEAAAIDPKNPRLHTMMGRIMLERGRLERAYHAFDAAIELEPEYPDPRYYQGVVLQRWERREAAKARYQEAYDLQPDNVAYLLATVEMMVALDEVDESIVKLEDKLNYFDQSAPIRVALAHLYAMKQQPDRALTFFKEATLLDPDNQKLQEDFALAQVAAGRHAEAITTLERLMEDPKTKQRRDLRRVLAECYLNTERLAKAREHYLALARSGDGEAHDWVRLGEMALKDGDLFSALEAANQAVRMDPQSHEGYLLAGMVWQKRGKLEEALRMFDRAAELAPMNAAPLILRGIALERAGRATAAAEAYAEALRRQPDDSRAQRLLSNVQ